MLDWLADPNLWASLLTLTFLEIVLGIDNIIFLSIITERVAENRRILPSAWGCCWPSSDGSACWRASSG